MKCLRVVPVFLSMVLLTSCFDDKSDQIPKQGGISVPAASNNDTQAGDAAKGNSRYAHTKTIFCKMTSSDGKRVTTSSFFKYNPNTVDEITIDMLGDYPDQFLLERLNNRNKRHHLTDARIEIPLRGGNQVFPVDVDNIWFTGSTSIQFFKPKQLGGLTHWDQGTMFFGSRISVVTFEGTLQITYGDEIRVSSGGWHYAPGGNNDQLEFGGMKCQDKHY